MICGAALTVGGHAFAQQAASGSSTVGEIVVTGSRIPTPNLTSVSPITTVGQQQVQLQGISSVEDLINNLPQAFGDFGNYESNGSSGTATIDLRGIGNKRTLVLVNGQRLMPGDPTTAGANAPDIDMIPAAMIDRVDVLTGGASAVYGSDAIAGVVNFLLKKNFQGLQIDEQTSVAEDDGGSPQTVIANNHSHNTFGFPSIQFPGNVWDGWRQTVTITGGINSADDKGNVTFYLGYTYIQAVDEGQRDYSKCTLATNNTSTTFQYCGGSSSDVTGRLHPTSGPNAGNNYDITLPPAAGNLLQPLAPGQYFNYAPYNYFQRPDQRYTAGEFSHYDYADWLSVYSSVMFMDDHSVAAVAPSGSFYGDRVFTIPCDDPLLSSAQANTLCGPGPYAAGDDATAEIGRRNVEGLPRLADLEHMDYRLTLGARGDLGGGWSYDLNGLYGRSVLTESQDGYFLYSKLENALNVVSDPRVGSPTFGQPVCASVVSGADTSCVPYNLWTAGGVTTAAENYLSGEGINSGSTTEQDVTFTLANPDLSKLGLKSPMANSGVGVSLGAEYRYDALVTNYDATIQSGDLAGFGGKLQNTSGSQISEELFGEIRVPIVQDMPLFQDLTFDGGYRFSDYSHGGGNSTYKVGLEWQVDPDIKFRASFERAARAPNVQELFAPFTPGLVAGSDPCAAPSHLTAAQCYNTMTNTLATDHISMTEAQFAANVFPNIAQCVSAQCGAYTGGNPNLSPEVGNTYSVGVQLTPRFLTGFSATIDYWNIKVNKAIINLTATTLVTNCALSGNPFDCSQILRFPGGGYTIYGGNGQGYVALPLVNASSLQTNGVDVNGNYRVPLDSWGVHGIGSLNLNMMGTYVDKLKTTLPDGTSFDCGGLYGVTCTTPTPHWRHTLRATWSTPWRVDMSLAWRYISGTALDFNTNQQDLQDGVYKDLLPTDAHIPAYSYFDLAFTYRVRNGLSMRLGVNNIFDKQPPLLDANSFGISAPPFGNGNTYPEVYDPLGRVIFMGLTANF